LTNNSEVKPKKNELSDFTISFDLNSVYDNTDELNLGFQFKALNTELNQKNSLGIQTDLEKFAGSINLYVKYKLLRYENFGLDFGTRYNVFGLNSNGGTSFEPRVGLTYVLIPQII
jgi:hypothetical protein